MAGVVIFGAGLLDGTLGIWGAGRGRPDAWLLATLGIGAALVGVVLVRFAAARRTGGDV